MPKHEIVSKLGMTKDRFQFILRPCHTYIPDKYDKDNDIEGRDDENADREEDLVEQILEHVQQDQELDADNGDGEGSKDESQDE